MTAEQNYRLLQEIENNRKFILMAYLQNPKLLEQAEERIKRLFDMPVCNKNLDADAKQALQLGSEPLNLST